MRTDVKFQAHMLPGKPQAGRCRLDLLPNVSNTRRLVHSSSGPAAQLLLHAASPKHAAGLMCQWPQAWLQPSACAPSVTSRLNSTGWVCRALEEHGVVSYGEVTRHTLGRSGQRLVDTLLIVSQTGAA